MTNTDTGTTGTLVVPVTAVQVKVVQVGEFGSGPTRKRRRTSMVRVAIRRTYYAATVVGVAIFLVAAGMNLQHFLDHRTALSASAVESGANAAPADSNAGNFVAAGGPTAVPRPAGAPVIGNPHALPPPLAASDARASQAIGIHIPRLNVNKSLVDLHVQSDRSMSVPQNFSDVGWWRDGPRPGGPGATLVAGHVDSRNGPEVFYRLKDMVAGDLVTVDRADHTSVLFKVVGKASYPRSDFPDDVVYRVRGKPSLHLLTCDALDPATGHHTANLVVFADLVSTGPTKHPVR